MSSRTDHVGPRRGFLAGRAASGCLALLLLSVGAKAPAPESRGAGRSLCDRAYPSDRDVAWSCRTIGRNESLERLFGEDWVAVARFNRIDRRHVVPGLRIKVPIDLASLERFTPVPLRYALADSDAKFVLVDLAEQFLGAYERGRLVFSSPIAAGRPEHPTPRGTFRVTAYDRDHVSSLYDIAETDRPYPMHFGLRFHVTAAGTYWIHGRDLPGGPVSHGCIGLYDEEMQRRYYGVPERPILADARRLFLWAVGSGADTTGLHPLKNGPRVQIVDSLLDTLPLLMSSTSDL